MSYSVLKIMLELAEERMKTAQSPAFKKALQDFWLAAKNLSKFY